MEKTPIQKNKKSLQTLKEQDLQEVLSDKYQKVTQVLNQVLEPLNKSFENSENGEKYNEILDTFLDEIGLEKNQQTRYIAYMRIVSLKVDPLKLYLEDSLKKAKENTKNLKTQIPNKLENKDYILNKAYDYVKRLYESYYEKFISELEKENILSDFELELVRGSLNVGKAFNIFGIKWLNHISKQNETLDKMFSSDSKKIMAYLKQKDLLEKNENGEIVDRAYSVLIGGKILSYAQAFPNEINNIVFELEKFISKLEKYDNKYKQEYIDYLNALKDALSEKNIYKTYGLWQKVDIAWMKIKSPLQIVHPMEYYDDKYRKAVAPEFDLRIKDESILKSTIENDVKKMWANWFERLSNGKYEDVKFTTEKNLASVQLYIGQPLIFSGNYLNGLFSAQVVPNDETVSAMHGKKIFAFPKMVLKQKQAQPTLKLSKIVLGEDFIKQYKQIEQDEQTYYKIYDIETIGHEFGHTLWLGENTEVIMNEKTGNFKNIEEFKATSGGFITYIEMIDNFSKGLSVEEKEFFRKMLVVHIMRAIGLLRYREITEILPYYFESLIHLDLLYKSGILNLDIENTKINTDFSEEKMKNFIENYKKTYEKLAKTYLNKKDAGEFLFDYAVVENGIGLPKDKKLREFVEKYYDLYKKIGNEIEN